MEPPSLATKLRKLRKLLVWLENSFKNRSIGLVGLVVSLKTIKWAWFYRKVGVASKISLVLHT